MSISLVINTLNEEKNIAGCINSAIKWVDEIIVCDMYSDDKTIEIAKSLNAKIFFHEKTGFVEPARHFAISQASCEWVLVLDADERMTEKLGKKIKEIENNNQNDLVLFGSFFNYFGAYVKYGGFFFLRWPRLFKKQLYTSTYNECELMVHANFSNVENNARNKIQLNGEYYILHDAYPTIEKFINKTVGMYARIEAEEMVKRGYTFHLFKLLYEPLKTFFGRYIVRLGFRDGIRGLILCYFYASYRFSIWANIWFIEDQVKQTKNK